MTRRPHAKIFKHGGTWYYNVHDSADRVVFTDNTGSWPPMLEAALRRVVAVREIESLHLRLPLYSDLVEAEFEHHGIPPEQLTIQPFDDFSKADGPIEDADWKKNPDFFARQREIDEGHATVNRLVADLESAPVLPTRPPKEEQWLRMEAADWQLHHPNEVWEWENGEGFTVLGTHDSDEALTRVRYHLLTTLGSMNEVLGALPYRHSFSEARRLWVNPKRYEDDFPAEQGHKHWWFGRQRIMLIKI
jgi:hypothetical protein